jgi:hypothetical protein
MPKRSSIRKNADANLIAKSILDQVTGDRDTVPQPDPDAGKNPAAVALGRLGGLKGGKARAKSLSKSKRAAIAKKAAQARWRKKKP